MPTTDMAFDGEAIAEGNLEQALFVNAGTDFCGAEISDDLPGKYKK